MTLVSRRSVLSLFSAGLLADLCVSPRGASSSEAPGPPPHLATRATYGVVPTEIFEAGRTLSDFGINAVFLNAGLVAAERVTLLRSQGARIYAEFNTMHLAEYLKERPDAAPVGADGAVSPPPDGWQGICPTHPGYRQHRMDAMRGLLEAHAIDGVWLDYHHAHASWEQATPNMPDTCFCARCLAAFARDTGSRLPQASTPELSRLLLGERAAAWTRWRCDVFTGWVREFREVVNRARPGALLGTFHNPWSDEDFDGARLRKLAIDLKAQARYIDVFSPMPYHARLGHHDDPGWISRQVAWLGKYLGIKGTPGERHRIWPIVQISDWGEPVPVAQVPAVLDHGARLPATGTIVFSWGSLRRQPEKIEALRRAWARA
jgi:hypothetical protein